MPRRRIQDSCRGAPGILATEPPTRDREGRDKGSRGARRDPGFLPRSPRREGREKGSRILAAEPPTAWGNGNDRGLLPGLVGGPFAPTVSKSPWILHRYRSAKRTGSGPVQKEADPDGHPKLRRRMSCDEGSRILSEGPGQASEGPTRHPKLRRRIRDSFRSSRPGGPEADPARRRLPRTEGGPDACSKAR